MRSVYCDNCETTNGTFSACGTCKTVTYCSKKCQKGHWAFHRLFCGGKSDKMYVSRPSKDTCQTSLVASEDILPGTVLADIEPDVYLFRLPQEALKPFSEAQRRALCPEPGTCYSRFKTPEEDETRAVSELADILLEKYPQMTARIIGRARRLRYLPETATDYQVLCEHVRTYVFNVEALTNTIGLCYDDFIGRINHSCDPNATWVALPNRVVVSAIKPIARGEEVTISYIPVVYGFSKDSAAICRVQVKEACGFVCNCPVHSKDTTTLPVFPNYRVKNVNDALKLQNSMVGRISSLHPVEQMTISTILLTFCRINWDKKETSDLFMWATMVMWDLCQNNPKNATFMRRAWLNMIKLFCLRQDVATTLYMVEQFSDWVRMNFNVPGLDKQILELESITFQGPLVANKVFKSVLLLFEKM